MAQYYAETFGVGTMTQYYRFRRGYYDTVLQIFGVGIMTQYYRLSGWVL